MAYPGRRPRQPGGSTVLSRSFVFLPVVLLGFLCHAETVRAENFELRVIPYREAYPHERDGSTVRKASEAGVDLATWKDPMVVVSLRNGRLFHLFYTAVAGAPDPRPYVIQRARRTVREYRSAADTSPGVTVTYLVEAFKMDRGEMKRADQHIGTFSLGSYYRREVHKELEIGFGEIPGVAAGTSWPFERKILYKKIHHYDPDPTTFEQVRFLSSKKWTYEVSFDRKGSFSLRAPQLGISLPQ